MCVMDEFNVNGTRIRKFVWGDVDRSIWMIGIAISTSCFLITVLLALCKSKIKLEQKILMQMTMARVIKSIVEYFVSSTTFTTSSSFAECYVFTVYAHAETVLLWWMSIFTKNLYDKVIYVFHTEKHRFIVIFCMVWFSTVPLCIIYPFIVFTIYEDILVILYEVIKCIGLLLNLVLFGRIFRVIVLAKRKNSLSDLKATLNLVDIVKISVISFLLVTTAGFEALTSMVFEILHMYFHYYNANVAYVVCLVNTLQPIATCAVFCILFKKPKK